MQDLQLSALTIIVLVSDLYRMAQSLGKEKSLDRGSRSVTRGDAPSFAVLGVAGRMVGIPSNKVGGPQYSHHGWFIGLCAASGSST